MSRHEGFSVLHVGKFYPPHSGGMETHLADLCGGLKDHVDVSVVVASDDRTTTTNEIVDGVPVSRIATPYSVASTPLCPQMSRAIGRSSADIVHLHHPNPMAFAAFLVSGHKGRLVVTYHSDIVRQKVLAKAISPMLDAALSRANRIIVTSQRYADTSSVLVRYADTCRVIPLGVSLDEYAEADSAEVETIRAEFGPRIVLGVGRLIYYKGFEYLLRAMRTVDARLLIVGVGPLREPLAREAEALGVSERVTFLGAVPSTVPYYHAADVFAFPSIARSEAYGLVQLEAMASGTPVVNTDLDSGVPFVSPHEVSGLTVPPCDAHALAAALNRLLSEASLRERLGRGGLERARTEFGLDAMVERTMALYREVLGRVPEPAREPAMSEAT